MNELTKDTIEQILVSHGVAFTDSLSDWILKEIERAYEEGRNNPRKSQYVFLDLKAEGDPLYYSILAYDTTKKKVIDGFGTYDIKVLSGYLKKYFGLPKYHHEENE